MKETTRIVHSNTASFLNLQLMNVSNRDFFAAFNELFSMTDPSLVGGYIAEGSACGIVVWAFVPGSNPLTVE